MFYIFVAESLTPAATTTSSITTTTSTTGDLRNSPNFVLSIDYAKSFFYEISQ